MSLIGLQSRLLFPEQSPLLQRSELQKQNLEYKSEIGFAGCFRFHIFKKSASPFPQTPSSAEYSAHRWSTILNDSPCTVPVISATKQDPEHDMVCSKFPPAPRVQFGVSSEDPERPWKDFICSASASISIRAKEPPPPLTTTGSWQT